MKYLPNLLIAVCSILLWIALSCYGSDVNCNPHFHDKAAVDRTVVKAKELLSRFPTDVAIKDRLAVMILFSRGFHPQTGTGNNRLNYLHCALKQYLNRVAKTTPSDVYIWVTEPEDPTQSLYVPTWLNSTAFPRVYIVPIPKETWRVPCGLLPNSQWNLRKHFDVDYYIMGRWRLTFSLDFAKAMGYDYHLQFDDDAVLLSDVSFNIVNQMRTNSYDMAVTSDRIGENSHVVLGLAELSNFWIRMNKYQPEGDIYEHCKPKDITGLLTDTWDKSYHPGYWIITSIPWWYSEKPANFLETILRSGKDVEGRWQEQGVMNIMQQIFLPQSRVLIMDKPDIGHDRHRPANFVKWCEQQGYPAIYF